MMKKLIAALFALVMLLSVAVAEEVPAPYAVVPPQPAKAVFTLEGNPTTGFSWYCSVKNEGVVTLSGDQGEYVQTPAEPELVGVGGTFTFELIAKAPGEAVVQFVYGRPWESDDAASLCYLIVVLEDGAMEVRDLTGIAPLEGVVLSVEEDTALIETAQAGHVLCRFPADMALPVEAENITVWFNGVMALSLPGQINVIAWETVAPEMAREK